MSTSTTLSIQDYWSQFLTCIVKIICIDIWLTMVTDEVQVHLRLSNVQKPIEMLN